MTRRRLMVVASVIGLALTLGMVLSHPRVAWEVAHARAVKRLQDVTVIDYAALASRLEAYLESDPHPIRARDAVRSYFKLLGEAEAAQTPLHALAKHPNAQIRAMAQADLRRRALLTEPVELRFIALDGRAVDLAALRGKVVLLEFWAAWCPTCRRELPNLKAVYDKYRDQGFEIVGIALDDAQDEHELLALLKRENLTWPQYFPGDGHYTTSEISKRFGVVGIPAAFLLDRQGLITTTDVRGKRLEPAVRRLLRTQIPGTAAPLDTGGGT